MSGSVKGSRTPAVAGSVRRTRIGRRRRSLRGGDRGRDQARCCGRFGLWGFDGGKVVAVRCEFIWMARIWPAAPTAEWICADFVVGAGGSGRVNWGSG